MHIKVPAAENTVYMPTNYTISSTSKTTGNGFVPSKVIYCTLISCPFASQDIEGPNTVADCRVCINRMSQMGVPV